MEKMVIISERTLYNGKIWVDNSSKIQQVVLTLRNEIQYNVPCVNLETVAKGEKYGLH